MNENKTLLNSIVNILPGVEKDLSFSKKEKLIILFFLLSIYLVLSTIPLYNVRTLVGSQYSFSLLNLRNNYCIITLSKKALVYSNLILQICINLKILDFDKTYKTEKFKEKLTRFIALICSVIMSLSFLRTILSIKDNSILIENRNFFTKFIIFLELFFGSLFGIFYSEFLNKYAIYGEINYLILVDFLSSAFLFIYHYDNWYRYDKTFVITNTIFWLSILYYFYSLKVKFTITHQNFNFDEEYSLKYMYYSSRPIFITSIFREAFINFLSFVSSYVSFNISTINYYLSNESIIELIYGECWTKLIFQIIYSGVTIFGGTKLLLFLTGMGSSEQYVEEILKYKRTIKNYRPSKKILLNVLKPDIDSLGFFSNIISFFLLNFLNFFPLLISITPSGLMIISESIITLRNKFKDESKKDMYTIIHKIHKIL